DAARSSADGSGPSICGKVGRNANQRRGPSSGSTAETAAPVAAGRPAQVDPTPRATATRSPSTALLVAAPPAPGPAIRIVPSGSASISIRLVTPSVQPNGLSDATAVGITAASMSAPRRLAVASNLMVEPSAAAPS